MQAAGDPNAIGNLTLRVVSAAVLAPLALMTAYVGGWAFLLLWMAAAGVIFWEWTAILHDAKRPFVLWIGGTVLVLSGFLVGFGYPGLAAAVIVTGMISVSLAASPQRRVWTGSGLGYAASLLFAAVVLRIDPVHGFAAIAILFAIVWATDIFGYFVGRWIGGPRLAPRISPKKTISGAIGGLVGAVAATLGAAALMGLPNPTALAIVAVALSAVSQVGDLFESAVKRTFGVKDASRLIPGHGGLMDRLDGFQAAVCAGALFGLLRGGLGEAARGLILW